MKNDQLFILPSSHYTNIKITEHTLNICHKRDSPATDLPTQHGIPTATRHALLAATTVHGQPARHATTPTIHVPQPGPASPTATKRSSTPNADRWCNDLQQLHKPAFVRLHCHKGTRFRSSRIAPYSKTPSNGYHNWNNSPWRRFNGEHMLGILQLPRVWG